MSEKLTLASLNKRVVKLEDMADDISKIKNLIKVYAPIAITAAVTSGYLGEAFGNILQQIAVAIGAS